ELFGPKVAARMFTSEEIKHAKTVVRAEDELFVSFGELHPEKAVCQLCIPFSANVGYATLLAVGYYLIGQIQRQHPPYFKKNLIDYTRRASEMFGEEITVIVE